jgi:hypothetical protein
MLYFLPFQSRGLLACGFLFLLTAPAAVAQRGFSLGTQFGPGFSSNSTQASVAAGRKVRTFNHLSFALTGTATYRFNAKYGLEAAAGWYLSHDGLKYDQLITGRDAQGQLSRSISGSNASGFDLRQVRVHGLRYWPLGSSRWTAFVGAGGGLVWGQALQNASFGSSRQLGDIDHEHIWLQLQRLDGPRIGYLAGVQMGMLMRMGNRGTLQLAAQHHHGLRTLYGARSTEYLYTDAYRGISESYNVTYRNRGTHSVFTVGYQYRLTKEQ